MATVNCGKVWDGALATDDLILNGSAVAPVAFDEDDAGNDLQDAINATSVSAAMVGGDLVLSFDGQIEIVGCVPWATMADRQPAIPGMIPGQYE